MSVIKKSLNFEPKKPKNLKIILQKKEKFKILENNFEIIKSYIKNNMR